MNTGGFVHPSVCLSVAGQIRRRERGMTKSEGAEGSKAAQEEVVSHETYRWFISIIAASWPQPAE